MSKRKGAYSPPSFREKGYRPAFCFLRAVLAMVFPC